MPNPSDKAMRVRQVYSELDRKFEEQETQRRARLQNIPYINLYGFPVETQALDLMPKERAETLQAAIFFKIFGVLILCRHVGENKQHSK